MLKLGEYKFTQHNAKKENFCCILSAYRKVKEGLSDTLGSIKVHRMHTVDAKLSPIPKLGDTAAY